MTDLNFLLTETALKLLGNDFFDIEGVGFENLKELINFHTKPSAHNTSLEQCLDVDMESLMTKSETDICKQPYLEHINSTKSTNDAEDDNLLIPQEDDHDGGKNSNNFNLNDLY